MKSILQEATSVERAVSLAWEAVGKPREFCVKVLEFGEKGFFGITKKNTVISLSYESKNVSELSRVEKASERPSKTFGPPKGSSTEKRNHTPKKKIESRPKIEEPANWNDEMIQITTTTIKGIISTLGVDAKLKTRTSSTTLFVTICDQVLPEAESERALRATMSYLVFQILKRELKRKLRGFKIHIDSESKS
ncbi:Jag N-terminal domain-containing protein [Candidatus Dependentiae bacterium]